MHSLIDIRIGCGWAYGGRRGQTTPAIGGKKEETKNILLNVT